MIDRTRYKVNKVNYTNQSDRVGTKRRYCRYKSGTSWSIIDATDNSALSLSNSPEVVMLTDQIYTAAEKAAIKKKTGRRVLVSKKAHSWKSTFSTFFEVIIDGKVVRVPTTHAPVIKINNSVPLTTARTADYLEFKGLPNEARNQFGFNYYTLEPYYKMRNSSFSIPEATILASFQKMCKDANLLNLHDQNIFTTIGELKDFKQTVRTVTKHVFSDKKYIADKYLGVNFGLIPFYDDMKKYVENYNNFAPNLKKWNQLGEKGKILNKHRLIFKDKFEDSFTITSGTYPWPSGFGTYRYKAKYSVIHNSRFLSHMYFRAKPLKGEDQNELIRSINGISKPFTAAWNLIPFSFLVDWFVDVGDKIEQMEYQKPVVEFDILDTCYSMKFDQTLKCDLFFVDNGTGEETYLGSSELTQKFFKRIPKDSKYIKDVINSVGVISPLQFKTELSGYQWSLAAALAVTNLKLKK